MQSIVQGKPREDATRMFKRWAKKKASRWVIYAIRALVFLINRAYFAISIVKALSFNGFFMPFG